MKYKAVVPIPEGLHIDDPEAFERMLEDELRTAIIRQIDENIQRDIDGEPCSFPPTGLLTSTPKPKVTCWLCDGTTEQTCQCHNSPPASKPRPCNMVCNP